MSSIALKRLEQNRDRPIPRKKYKTREEALQTVFDYIEFFYNPQRKHVRNQMLTLIDFEQQQKLKLQSVLQTRGYSA